MVELDYASRETGREMMIGRALVVNSCIVESMLQQGSLERLGASLKLHQI